ncbi:MAG: hypothetical protein EBZ62_00235 [Sphingobacteriia bacterium]|nr:hypothetical protein [Sphingobacteriia bacterium]
MDLALYAGVALIIFVLFKDKLSPVQKLLGGLIEKVKGLTSTNNVSLPVVTVPKVDPVVLPKETSVSKDDIFFKLVVSWKQTRDLAEKSGCTEAVKVADQMFPFLSPRVCGSKEDKVL